MDHLAMKSPSMETRQLVETAASWVDGKAWYISD